MPDIESAGRTAQLLAELYGADPFTSQQAHAVVSPRALRTALSRGTVRRVQRGAYAVNRADSDLTRYRVRIAATLTARPSGVASDESALALHGLSLPHFDVTWDEQPVRLIAQRGERVRNDRLRVSRKPLPDAHHTTTPYGPATTPVRTAVDLARRLDFTHALVVADEACAAALLGEVRPASGRPSGAREVLADRAEDARALILSVSSEASGSAGVRRIRRVAEWVDPAAESPGESFSRAHLVAAGLPRPVVGLPVVGDNGRLYYADLAWPEFGVIAEVDGLGKYQTDPQWVFRREKDREDALRAAGWIVVRWTVTEVLRNPALVIARVRRAFLVAERQASRRLPL